MFKMLHNWGVLALSAGLCLAATTVPSPRSDSPGRDLDLRRRDSRAATAMSAEQRARVQQAITAIKNGPPASITFRDSTGNVDTLSTQDIAKGLQKQLEDGRIKVDSTLSAHDYAVTTPDGRSSDAADEVDFHPDVLSGADSLFLQEVLVHEYRHKSQATGSEAADEVEAYSLELSYKDSLDIDSTNVHLGECRDNLAHYQGILDDAATPRERRRSAMAEAAGRYWQLVGADPAEGEACFLQSRLPGQSEWLALPPLLGGLVNARDLLRLPTPDGHTLLACGVTTFGAGALVRLTVDPMGGAVEALILLRFGENFFCMTPLPTPGSIAVLDITQNRVRRFFDSNGDGVPDANGGVMVQLDPTATWRRLDWASHPQWGPGLAAGGEDRLFSHLRRLMEPLHLFQDPNGDNVYELIHPTTAFEYLDRVPVIQEPYPQPGDAMVLVSGSWQHEIMVWRTTPDGTPLLPLGSLILSAPEGLMVLNQPLGFGDWIRPLDLETGQWQGRAIRVGGDEPLPAPDNLAIHVEAVPGAWAFLLTWDPVPGALYYRIEADPGTGQWLPFADVTQASHAWTMPANSLPARTLFRVRAVN